MEITYRRLASYALLVFGAAYLVVLIEVTHDADREGQLFAPIFLGVGLVLALLAHQVDRWWPVALVLVASALALLTELPYIAHVRSFDRAWEFAPISLTLLGLAGAMAFAGADLVQRRRNKSTVPHPLLPPAYAMVLGALVTLIVVSFVLTYAQVDTVSASERTGATVVHMNELKFSPSAIATKSGVPLKLVVENDDLSSHTFVLTAPGDRIDEYFGTGDEKLVSVAIDSPGTYTFRCDIDRHEKMKGTITVQ